MLGEKYVPLGQYETGEDPGDDQNFLTGDDFDIHRWTERLPMRDRDEVIDPEVFGSAHPGGFNASRVDGSVQFLSFTIDLELYQAFGHRFDHAVAPFERRM